MISASPDVVWVPGSLRVYKWISSSASHEVDSPWFGVGRFGDGSWKTLYVAQSADGAIAEFLRRNPEFIELQDDLTIELYEVDVVVEGNCLDVRTAAGQSAAGIAHDRLVSSDNDEKLRYGECRELANRAIADGYAGIVYPSAAANWPTWNLVLFGDPSPSTWHSDDRRLVDKPKLEAQDVRVLA